MAFILGIVVFAGIFGFLDRYIAWSTGGSDQAR